MADVESISSSVVREYLSRKGLKKTLEMLDIEMPRTKSCISNRALLAKVLHINSLMKQNKESEQSFRAMLEVIVQFMMSKLWKEKTTIKDLTSKVDGEKSKVHSKSLTRTKSLKNLKPQSLEHFDSKLGKTWSGFANDSDTMTNVSNVNEDFRPQSRILKKQSSEIFAKKRQERDTPLKSVGKDTSLVIPSTNGNSQSCFSPEVDKESLSNGHLRIKANLSTRSYPAKNISSHVKSTGIFVSPIREKIKLYGKGDLTLDSKHVDGDRLKPENKVFQETRQNFEEEDPASSKGIVSHQASSAKQGSDGDLNQSRMLKTKQLSHHNKGNAIQDLSKRNECMKNEELVFEDIDEDFNCDLGNENAYVPSPKSLILAHPCHSITLQQAKDLKSIIFGSSAGCFNPEWRHQGFPFCDMNHLNYGIIQHKGGPCGLLACVQAFVLKHLLFNKDITESRIDLHFTSKELDDALCRALVEILWRAGGSRISCVAIRSKDVEFIPSVGYKPDGLTEKLVIHEIIDKTELDQFIHSNLKQFFSDDAGCIFFLYSLILSRTSQRIKEDMDDENGTLMGAHGYCTQEMVNLLLFGKARSNTFDDVIELDTGGETKNLLKGVDEQSEIGLLSLFEHYKSCMVGANLKCPKNPIWVVCSESHFSVLFSMKRNILNERRMPKKFDLYYYDGLARQTEEIRLTIDTRGNGRRKDELDELIPPLEHCIRTKWKNAHVEWNETEPLL